MADPILDLCSACGAHHPPRKPIKAKLDAYDRMRLKLEAEVERLRKSPMPTNWQRANRLQAILGEGE